MYIITLNDTIYCESYITTDRNNKIILADNKLELLLSDILTIQSTIPKRFVDKGWTKKKIIYERYSRINHPFQ